MDLFKEDERNEKVKLDKNECIRLIKILLAQLKKSDKNFNLEHQIKTTPEAEVLLNKYLDELKNKLIKNKKYLQNQKNIELKKQKWINYVIEHRNDLSESMINWIKNQPLEIIYQIYLRTVHEGRCGSHEYSESLSRKEKIYLLADISRGTPISKLTEEQKLKFNILNKMDEETLDDFVNAYFKAKLKSVLDDIKIEEDYNNLNDGTYLKKESESNYKKSDKNLKEFFKNVDMVFRDIVNTLQVPRYFNEKELNVLNNRVKKICLEDIMRAGNYVERENELNDLYVENLYIEIEQSLWELGMNDKQIGKFYDKYEDLFENNIEELGVVIFYIDKLLRSKFKNKVIDKLPDRLKNIQITDEKLGKCKFHEKLRATNFNILQLEFLLQNCNVMDSEILYKIFNKPSRGYVIKEIQDLIECKENYSCSKKDKINNWKMLADYFCYNYIMNAQERGKIDHMKILLGEYRSVCPKAFEKFDMFMNNLKWP